MRTSPVLTVAEYFAGIGLMRLGLDRAGWRAVFANDIDPKKQEMYGHHFGPSPEFVLGDIHSLDVATIPSTVLATASFPCNDRNGRAAAAVRASRKRDRFSLLPRWG
jgi:DNA (cytosine-5)-methyltransferase 1